MELKIGELAKECGVSVDTIRYYERINLIKPDFKTKAGYRKYSLDKVKELKFIKKAKTLGFTLDEISKLMDLSKSEKAKAGEILDIVLNKLNELNFNLIELKTIHYTLSNLANKCPVDAPSLECPVIMYLYDKKILNDY